MSHPAFSVPAANAGAAAPTGYAVSAAYTSGWRALVARAGGDETGSATAFASLPGQGGRRRSALRARRRRGRAELLVGESWFGSPWLEPAAAEQAVLLRSPRTTLHLANLLGALSVVGAGATTVLILGGPSNGLTGVGIGVLALLVTLLVRWTGLRLRHRRLLLAADGARELVGTEALLGLHAALDSTRSRGSALLARLGLEQPAVAPELRSRWTGDGEDVADPVEVALPAEPRRMRARRAYGLVLGLYALGFGSAVVSAGLFLSDTSLGDGRDAGYTWQPMVASAVQQLGADLLLVVTALLLAARIGLTRRDLGVSAPRTRAALRGDLLGFAVTIVSFGVASGLMSAVDSRGYPGQDGGPWIVLPTLTTSVMAGPTEELVCLAFLVATLRLARQPWPRILALGLVLRLAFHIYYGWPAVFLSVWALSVLVCFAVTRRLLGVILAHSLIDVTVTVAQLDESVSGGILSLELLALLVALVVVVLRLGSYRAAELSAALHPAPLHPAAADYSVAASSGSSLASG